MSTYADALRDHLVNYKRAELGSLDDGNWSKTKQAYRHILPEASHRLNLCAALRSRLWDVVAAHSSWTRHRDFHHLNSSQAMCWNLLVPAKLHPDGNRQLTMALELPAPVKTFDLEVVRDRIEFTNFDCVLELAGGGRAYVEVKLTEAKFGSAQSNDERRQKRERHYLPLLANKVRGDVLEEESFFKNYQLLRNLSYLNSREDRLVLLLPRASIGLARQALAFVELVLPPWRSQVSVLYVEDVIERLLALQSAGPFKEHFEECRRKYVLP